MRIYTIKVKLFFRKHFIRPSNYCSVNVPLCDRSIRPVRALSALRSTFSSVINSDILTGRGGQQDRELWTQSGLEHQLYISASACAPLLSLFPPTPIQTSGLSRGPGGLLLTQETSKGSELEKSRVKRGRRSSRC